MSEFSAWFIFFITFNVLNFPKDIATLKLLRINVPKLVVKGEIIILRCEYELEGDNLYSVLWYKDHEEFYRFVPRNDPKQHSYKLEGFRVETHKSNDQQVLLRNINLKASGVYRCEVSAEAPSFNSVHGEGRMEVIAPPKNDPEIVGDRKVYQIGDILSLNCTSGKSYPSARLKWFVNDIQVVYLCQYVQVLPTRHRPVKCPLLILNHIGRKPDRAICLGGDDLLVNPDYEAVFQHHGLLATIIGLNLEIQTQHFKENRIIVRCVSSLYGSKSSFFEGSVTPPIDRREALFLVEGGGNTERISKWIVMIVLLIFLT